MNKPVRFLIVFIIVVVMFTLTWKIDSQDSRGALVGDSFSTFGSIVVTPSAVAENTEDVENTGSLHNLVLVEFFAGY